jgi:carbon-monoxide dehydrogenase small subunit
MIDDWRSGDSSGDWVIGDWVIRDWVIGSLSDWVVRMAIEIQSGGRFRLALTVNGEPADVLVDAYKTLLEVLREDLQLTGTKHGCELGECGACAVLVDGEPVLSCLFLGVECGGRLVTTVEGLPQDGALHPLQDAFADLGGSQCGYCTPGILMTAKALLDREPSPTPEQIKEALAGNLCRCTGYLQIVEAVERAAEQVRAGAGGCGQVRARADGCGQVRAGADGCGQVRAGAMGAARAAGGAR